MGNITSMFNLEQKINSCNNQSTNSISPISQKMIRTTQISIDIESFADEKKSDYIYEEPTSYKNLGFQKAESKEKIYTYSNECIC